jgi:hypothetical protein
LHDVLEREWRFDGVVGSDCPGTHSAVEAVNAGLDQSFTLRDWGAYYRDLPSLVRAGKVARSTIDTFPRSADQSPATGTPRYPAGPAGYDYTEGLNVGYRGFDADGLSPLFPFGFGLSYTNLQFTVANTGNRAGGPVRRLERQPGRLPDLGGPDWASVYAGVRRGRSATPPQVDGEAPGRPGSPAWARCDLAVAERSWVAKTNA